MQQVKGEARFLIFSFLFLFHIYRVAGLVVKVSALGAEDLGFESPLRRDFSGSSYQWLKNQHSSGYPARRPALKGQHWDCLARCHTVTGWGKKCWICNFYLSVAARKIVQFRPWDTLACCWDITQPTNFLTFFLFFLPPSLPLPTWCGWVKLRPFIMASCGTPLSLPYQRKVKVVQRSPSFKLLFKAHSCEHRHSHPLKSTQKHLHRPMSACPLKCTCGHAHSHRHTHTLITCIHTQATPEIKWQIHHLPFKATGGNTNWMRERPCPVNILVTPGGDLYHWKRVLGKPTSEWDERQETASSKFSLSTS